MKTCFKCCLIKPLSDFYPHPKMADGYLGKCKKCTKLDVKERTAVCRPARSAYEKRRNQTPERRDKKHAYEKAYKKRNPVKVSARNKLTKAVASGKLKKQPCVHCGRTTGVQAHHPDHTKPLDVVWACFKCHREHEHGQVVVAPF